jgi:hypothetical protein
LLEEQEKLTNNDTKDMDDDDKKEQVDRLIYIAERLDLIDYTRAESKAIEILTGLGFT